MIVGVHTDLLSSLCGKKSNDYFLNDPFFNYNIFKNVFLNNLSFFSELILFCFNCKRDIVFTLNMCFK